jgi:hypothetical protein
MRRQDKSTQPPPIPPTTPGEEQAQNFLRRVRELLWFVEFFLDRASELLPYPPDAQAEDMGSGLAHGVPPLHPDAPASRTDHRHPPLDPPVLRPRRRARPHLRPG